MAEQEEMFIVITSLGDLVQVMPIVWNQRECEIGGCDIMLIDENGKASHEYQHSSAIWSDYR